MLDVPTAFSVTTSSGVNRVLRRVGVSEATSYDLLGRGVGVGLRHAFHEGTLHCPAFKDRVVAYRVLVAGDTLSPDEERTVEIAERFRTQTGQDYLAVAFYERRS